MTEENTNMVKVRSKNRVFYMDRWLVDNLDQQKDLIKHNDYFVYIVDGKTGSGKTHFVINQIAIYLDPEFTPDNIVYDVDSFIHKLHTLPKYSVIVIDESFIIATARRRLHKEVIKLVDHLMTCRTYNKFIFLICPQARELDKYIREDQAVCLIRTYYGKGRTRGFFMYYHENRLYNLFSDNYKLRLSTKPNFYGRFTSFAVWDMDKLDREKEKQLDKRYEAQYGKKQKT